MPPIKKVCAVLSTLVVLAWLLFVVSSPLEARRSPAAPGDDGDLQVYLPLVMHTLAAGLNAPPYLPAAPSPPDGATDQAVGVDLSWAGGDPDGDAVTYDLYFEAGDGPPQALVAAGYAGTIYNPGPLDPYTRYAWQVVAADAHGAVTLGPVWSFTTGESTICTIELALAPPQVSALTVTVSGTVTSACSTITGLSWQWGDGVLDDQDFPATHTYALAGTYAITATATNDLGQSETAATVATVAPLSDEVTIPAGAFQMGCDPDNAYCGPDETPLHTVTLDAYTLDRYEVTNAEFAAFLQAEGNQTEGGAPWLDVVYAPVRIEEIGGVWQVDTGYEGHPAVNVTWYGARAYCAWQGKRLPTEAEWEKAARGSSDTRRYPWGDLAPSCSRANYKLFGSIDVGTWCVGDTVPVGSYPTGASPYGVLDMAGNVWEWVSDWYGDDYYSAYPAGSWPANPTGPASGTSRSVRGGGWDTIGAYIRVPERGGILATASTKDIGFRCAGDAPTN